MRILHSSPVSYIQQSNNTNTATSLAATTNSSTSTKRSDIIGHLPSSTEDYSTDLSNLNGNSNEGKYSYGLIDADDNVNLTISSSHNLSVRYTKNQNTTNNKATVNSDIALENLCNNLNQLNNLKSGSTEQKLNGNDNDTRQIFEGNLNVLEIGQESSPNRPVPSSEPSTLSQLDKTREENVSSIESNISEEEDEHDEIEELESLDGRNLICNKYHLNKVVRNVSNSPKHNRNPFKVRNSGHINLSSTKLRQNLAKLELETNLQNSFQNHQNQQQQFGGDRHNQSNHTYKRGTSVTPIDRQSSTGRVSGYSSVYSCETSPDDSFMEDEDAYSPSPSSSTSLTSPEPSNFPRGIINPNYPGFQHLAHTLSEHFVNHSDADDSDLSEFEVELSVESLDESFDQFNSNSCNNNNSINNNNNNEIRTCENMSPNDELNYNLETKVPKECREHKSICLPEIRVSSSLGIDDDCSEQVQQENIPDTDSEVSSKNLDQIEEDTEVGNVENDLSKCNQSIEVVYATEDISCDLDTYLKKYETSADVKEKGVEFLEYETKESETRNCPTPDILLKNGMSSSRQKSSENRPDLLRNVNLRPETINLDDQLKNQQLHLEEKISRIPVPDNIPIEAKRPEKDDGSCGSYGVTPVDIIGDFGREVEREFGLIVSGYNTRILCKDYSLAASASEQKHIMKTADAVLSDGKEQLSMCSGENRGSLAIVQSTDFSTCDLLQQSASDKYQNHKEISETDLQVVSLEHDNLKDKAVTSSSKVITKNSISTKQNSSAVSDTTVAVSCGEKLIPTAIVKPKYQKSSYDDRQLPPIGLGYCDYNRAWYENKCNSHQHANAMIQSNAGTSGNDQRSRKMQQQQQFAAHFDRNSKFSKKIISRGSAGSGNSVLSSKLPNSRRFEKDTDGSVSVVAVVTPRKKDKMEINTSEKKCKLFAEKNNNNSSSFSNNNNNLNCTDLKKREHLSEKNRKDQQSLSASFDVYNIETALPVIDLEAIENHLKKAKEEERKRRNDREEIRRRLAMGAEDDYFSKIVSADRPGRKPSLQSRLQSGMNLQICFMNEASSDTESPSSDSETCPKLSKAMTHTNNMSRYSSLSAHPYNSRPLSVSINGNNNRKSMNRPSTLSLGPPVDDTLPESDFFTKQARLQIEARMALAQAKDMAHMQMEIERQKQKQSPITEVIRNSLEKVGVPFPPEKRRLSRLMLTDMNIAQLQIIVNELHSQIERLNEQLVQYLMERDELHMSQDSMLVDIEDLTRYLGAKEQSKVNEKTNNSNLTSTNNPSKGTHTIQQTTIATNPVNMTTSHQPQSKLQRIASLVKK